MAGRGKALDFRTTDEFNSLKEENRVLTEAVDVLTQQVDEYENEIRALKDFKSPGKGSRNRTPRRAITSVADASPYLRSGSDEPSSSTGALEATLFRPALQKALRDAAKWKAAAISKSLLDLPPLPVPPGYEKGGAMESASTDLMELTAALASCRLEKSAVTLVDLTRRDKTPRMQLRESNARIAMANERLESVVRRCAGRKF